jgi:hypothetical protein
MPRPSHNAYAYAFGDVPYVCGELRAAARRNLWAGGGSRNEQQPSVRTHDIAHRDSVNNR